MNKALTILIALSLITGCAKNPVTGKSELHLVSEQQEIAIGESNYQLMQQAEGGAYVTDKEIEEYVQEVGMKLAKVSDRPDLPFEFVVLNNSVPNAWALPGGKIAINRGLLVELKSEAELAAVLAHEIVHSAARHGAKNMERGMLMAAGLIGLDQLLEGHKYEDVAMGTAVVGAGLITLKYSREAELEADRYGIKYMALAGYDPHAAVELQKTFLRLSEENGGQSNWLSGLFATHPPSQERIDANEITADSYPPGGRIGTNIYAKKIAKLKEDEEAYKDLDNGYAALKNQDARIALRSAEAGIKREPNEPHLFNLKGKAEVQLKSYDTALSSFNRAIELNPNYFDFYLERGLLQERLGNITAARADLEKSQSLLPSAQAHYALGMMDLNAGRRQEALQHFRVAAQVRSPLGQQAQRMAIQLGG